MHATKIGTAVLVHATTIGLAARVHATNVICSCAHSTKVGTAVLVHATKGGDLPTAEPNGSDSASDSVAYLAVLPRTVCHGVLWHALLCVRKRTSLFSA